MVAENVCAYKPCHEPASRKSSNGSGEVWYCDLHHKIRSMRGKARKKGKYVPSVAEVEALFRGNSSMICPSCRKHMSMTYSKGSEADAVSLQHNCNGTLDLICFSCNSSHGQKPRDVFYFIPDSHKYCGRCSDIKLKASFYPNRTTRDRLQGYCKSCQSTLAKERRQKKHD